MKNISLLIHLFFLIVATSAHSNEFNTSDMNTSYQMRLDVGTNIYISRLYEATEEAPPPYNSEKLSQYIGLSIQKSVSTSSSIGSRIDIQDFDSYTMLSVRAIDYQKSLSQSFTVNAFIGAGRYQFRTPAYGYSAGAGLLYKPENWKHWGIQLEARYFDWASRDKLTDADPTGGIYGFSDTSASFQMLSVGINYYF
jgi:hypothetical protein